MLILFQRHIIYMGYVPLGARKQRLDDLPSPVFDRIQCSELNLEGRGASKLSGILVHRDDIVEKDVDVVLVYFQGNAGSPIHRAPIFSYLCDAISPLRGPKIAIVAMAPRSYWKSTPRWPTENGIIQDYIETLRYTLERFPKARLVLYGHSLGGTAAICTLSKLHQSHTDRPSIPGSDRIRGLVLENAFTSIPAMVRTLYPQKWLPYRYLGPFAFDKWDTLAALRAHVGQDTILGRVSREMLVLLSEYDEIVPPAMGLEIFNLVTRGQQSRARSVIIPLALHENAWLRKTWIDEIQKYLVHITTAPTK
ncbi:hypothetical protein P691DRAFT_710292 [Macrolepiota fuliginosa MF-IS2]|uniref:Alpha/beta-hydrolase n=1 Tax=Macrolepiota fuliginosa MF-IS2 TaxID=1400762 RepID=A0A9P5X6M5_9AGAR|nr:hypothetical protein P691DRAFT_710292 [Macrolepiota fuliginosa MF-IS2]